MGIGEWASSEQLAAALTTATAALAGLAETVHRLTGDDLNTVLPVVDGLAAAAAGARFTITAEAVARGEVTGSQAGTVAQWVTERCPHLDMRESALVAKAVRELTRSGGSSESAETLAGARRAVQAGRLSVPAACVVAAEVRQLTPLIEPSAMSAVVAGLVAMGEVDGPVGVRRVRPALLARYGLGEALQDVEDRHRGLTVLSCGHDIGGGITEYRMRLNPEGRAVVEAAINTASAPQPVDRDGTARQDPRTIDQRRGDALVDLCRFALGHSSRRSGTDAVTETTAELKPTKVRAAVKTTVVVTIPVDGLRTRQRAGVVLGGLDAGALLGPETVRKLACDAAIVPVVQGPNGEIVHCGRTRRRFSPAQVTTLWLRDRHCTFPGCQTPASWCDAHHVTHWVDGGSTDLDNAALLCGRHHTIVHRDRLTAIVTGTGVEWNQRLGSYDDTYPGAHCPEAGEPPPDDPSP